VNSLYEINAYNSLSIKGYNVSEELIAKVKSNRWSPETNQQDAKIRNTLAARGYYEAFQQVNQSLENILAEEPPGNIIKKQTSLWYQTLFSPAARANIISSTDLLDYRNDRIFIRNSCHSPPPKETILYSMNAFFNCIIQEKHVAVRATLGHYIFVFIHPYMDENGRVTQFILNTMLASGSYPWTIVEVKHRKIYINALETAHTENNLTPFIKFIIKEMKLSKKHLEK
jgi:hypothetical protein